MTMHLVLQVERGFSMKMTEHKLNMIIKYLFFFPVILTLQTETDETG